MRGLSKRTILSAASTVAGVAWLFGSVAVRVPWVMPPRRRPPADPPGCDFRLKSLDGLSLAATYWQGARDDAPGVLIVHGVAASRRVIAPNAAWLAARGYAVLTIDLRGHGGSDLAPLAFGWTESRDAHAAFAWLKGRQNGAPCAVVGISMGGASALIGPDGPVPADALALQGVYATFRETVRSRTCLFAGAGLGRLIEPLLSFQARPRLGVWPSRLSPVAAIANVRCPMLVIGGEKDPFTPPHETRALFEAARSPSKRLWIMPGLGHKGVSDTLGEDYREGLAAFLAASLGPP